jgi:hypothetical protein
MSESTFENHLSVRKEFAGDVADWLLEHWIDPTDYHAAWWPNKDMWFCKKEPLTKAALVRMFTSTAANTPVGSYYIDSQGNTKRVTIDIDAHKEGETAEEPLRRAQSLLDRASIPYILARSKGGKGYHIHIWFDKPLPAHVARNLGRDIVRSSGLPEKTEVFPKQDELREGEFGSQVALPGSLFFANRTNGLGSTLVDPGTLEPIPFGEWAEYLATSRPLTEEYLRKLCAEANVDLWQKREKPRQTYDSADFVAEGVPEFDDVNKLVGFLSSHGIEIQKEKGGFGEWTDRLLLRDCVNAEAHTSDRRDGAAILYSSVTKRVGYKCFHEGCSQFSWPKLLKKLGYRIRKAKHTEEVHKNPEPEKPDENYNWEKIEPGFLFHLTEEEKLAIRGEVLFPTMYYSIWAFKNAKNLAKCCERFFRKYCKEHGLKSVYPGRCEKNFACPNCSRHKWNSIYLPNIRDNWPEFAYIVEIPIGSPEDASRVIKDLNNTYRRNLNQKPRWLRGWKTVTLVFDPADKPYCDSFGLTGSLKSKKDYIPIIRDSYLSYSNAILEEYRKVGNMVEVLDNYKQVLSNPRRTAAGGHALKMFPWPSHEDEKQLREERWKREHPGLEQNCCDTVVGTKPNGSPLYCGLPYRTECVHRRTLNVFATYDGMVDVMDMERQFEIEDSHYFFSSRQPQPSP